MKAALTENFGAGQSDICEHLLTLRRYASLCAHVTEFGVRSGNSTIALLAGLTDRGGGDLVSYDITPFRAPAEWPLSVEPVKWIFLRQNTRELRAIAQTDLLFVDSSHEYPDVKHDLSLAVNARRFVIMHDTAKAWVSAGGPGVRRARDEFLAAHPERWRIKEEFENCNGLTVIERIAL